MSALQNGQQNIPEIIPSASPWIWSEDALPPMGVKVFYLDVDDAGQPTEAGTAVRENDWRGVKCYWMPIPALPRGGLLETRKQPETRVGAGDRGGHQDLPEGGAETGPKSPASGKNTRFDGGAHGLDRGDIAFIASELRLAGRHYAANVALSGLNAIPRAPEQVAEKVSACKHDWVAEGDGKGNQIGPATCCKCGAKEEARHADN